MSPILAPRPAILVNGQAAPALDAHLTALTVVGQLGDVSRCEATFENWGGSGVPGFLFFDRALLDFGSTVRVDLGGASPIFEGRILALEGRFPAGAPPRLTMTAEDRLAALRDTRRSRTFEAMTDADVIRRIAVEHGLTPRIVVTGPTHAMLTQLDQSDLAFLRARARAVGAEVRLDGHELHVAPRQAPGTPPIPLAYGSTLREIDVTASLAHQRTRVAAGGWDVTTASALEVAATGTVLAHELAGRLSGPALVESAFGPREETRARAAGSVDEARAAADAAFKAMARRFVTAKGIADPDPRIRAGAWLDLREIGPLFSGSYYVTEARVLYDGGHGARSAFRAESVGLGSRRAGLRTQAKGMQWRHHHAD